LGLLPLHAKITEAPQLAVPPLGGGDFGPDASRGQEPSYQPTNHHPSQDAELADSTTPHGTDNLSVQARDNPEVQSEGEGEVTGKGSEPSGSGLCFEIHDHPYWKKDDGSTQCTIWVYK